MVKFKVVKHGLKWHVIGFEGTKKPRNGKKATYKEQCISSHYTLKSADKAKAKYESLKLTLSTKSDKEPLLQRCLKELPLGFTIAVACGIIYEVAVKTTLGG